jgi:hypothetical protein
MALSASSISQNATHGFRYPHECAPGTGSATHRGSRVSAFCSIRSAPGSRNIENDRSKGSASRPSESASSRFWKGRASKAEAIVSRNKCRIYGTQDHRATTWPNVAIRPFIPQWPARSNPLIRNKHRREYNLIVERNQAGKE